MKFFVAVLALAAVASARPDVSHLVGQQQHQEPIKVLSYSSDIHPEGSYSYSYETENGISASESGAPKAIGSEIGIAAQGQFAYSGPEGPISLTYIADENGFQPQGAHLPVPPAIPEAIQRSLDYIATHYKPEHQQ